MMIRINVRRKCPLKLVLGCMRRADEDFGMISEGDHVVVGVSGGKDSLVLLYGLALYRHFCRHSFKLSAATLGMGLERVDFSPVKRLCDELDVPYFVKETDIGDVIFNQRKEPNPCALCAKMRRGALTDYCRAVGANKLALGHHRDDAIETMMLSLLYEGRLHTFHPVTYLSKQDVTQIRPMVYLPEKDIVHAAKKFNLPVTKSPCPVNGDTKRAEVKGLLDDLCKRYPRAREYMLNALRNSDQYGLWEKPKEIAGKPARLSRKDG
jgi:tRNA(Ile)-lysidine synthase TilS/MesJ